jgi:hypothetical protein
LVSAGRQQSFVQVRWSRSNKMSRGRRGGDDVVEAVAAGDRTIVVAAILYRLLGGPRS